MQETVRHLHSCDYETEIVILFQCILHLTTVSALSIVVQLQAENLDTMSVTDVF